MAKINPKTRLLKHVIKTDSCWIWTGATRGKGYGMMSLGSKNSISAHRFSYELFVGSIPEGMQIDHLCMNKLCVNPKHLEPVDNKENQRRAAESRGGYYPIELRKPQPITCLVCGKTVNAIMHERRKYCSNACKCKAKRIAKKQQSVYI